MFSISKILKQTGALLKGFPKATSLWPLLFMLVVVFAGRLTLSAPGTEGSYGTGGEFGFGGPAGGFSAGTLSLLVSNNSWTSDGLRENEEIVFDGALILGSSHPLSNLLPLRSGLQKYLVQEGDTLSAIAARFGVSVETVRIANPDLKSIIRPGDELTVLPVSGILYAVKAGDSLESIASRYRLDPQTISDYNPGYQKILDKPGESLVLPYAKPLASVKNSRYGENLPSLPSFFVLPARGWNWGRLHDYNAVDIADACGKPIYAAAEGLVVEESSEGYWNSGHGNYIILEHPNGTRTRYSHTSKNLVRVGEYISQSDHIALIGNTGNTHGPTGCHLHFEVFGARNPFAVY